MAEMNNDEGEILNNYPPVRRIYTFGHGQQHFPGYAVVYGVDGADCRAKMNRQFGKKWSMEYVSEEAAGVETWSLALVAILGRPGGDVLASSELRKLKDPA